MSTRIKILKTTKRIRMYAQNSSCTYCTQTYIASFCKQESEVTCSIITAICTFRASSFSMPRLPS
jgi:hypothetical protein